MRVSLDNMVKMCEWESPELAVQVLEEAFGAVSSVASNSDSGRIYFCSSDEIVRIWDAVTGTGIEKLSHDNGVWSLAVVGKIG